MGRYGASKERTSNGKASGTSSRSPTRTGGKQGFHLFLVQLEQEESPLQPDGRDGVLETRPWSPYGRHNGNYAHEPHVQRRDRDYETLPGDVQGEFAIIRPLAYVEEKELKRVSARLELPVIKSQCVQRGALEKETRQRHHIRGGKTQQEREEEHLPQPSAGAGRVSLESLKGLSSRLRPMTTHPRKEELGRFTFRLLWFIRGAGRAPARLAGVEPDRGQGKRRHKGNRNGRTETRGKGIPAWGSFQADSPVLFF